MTDHYDEPIEQIVQSVFATMLEVDVARTDSSCMPEHESTVASIHISGAWTGTVLLALPPELGRAAAAAMLQVSHDDLSDVDVGDTAAELVNMIGGNLKSLLPAPSFLSLPTIVTGRQFGMHIHDAELLDEVFMTSMHGPAQVRLYVRLPATELQSV